MTTILQNYIEQIAKEYNLSEEEGLNLMKMADEDPTYLYNQKISEEVKRTGGLNW